MTDIKNYRSLEAWEVAMDLVVQSYRITSKFPASERYGLAREIQRSSISVPSNVAEGYARGGHAELNHIKIALGSTAELDTQIEAAVRLAFVSAEDAAPARKVLTSERCLLYGLRRSRRQKLGLSAAGCVVWILLAIRIVG